MEKLTVKKKEKFDIDFLDNDVKNNDSLPGHKKSLKKPQTEKQKREKNNSEKSKKPSKNLRDKKDQKNNKNKKNMQKLQKKYAFLSKIKANWQHFLIFCILFTLSVAMTSITFLKSEYYEFLRRPKVIESSVSVLLLLILFAIVLLFLFVLPYLKNTGTCKDNGNNATKNFDSKDDDNQNSYKRSPAQKVEQNSGDQTQNIVDNLYDKNMENATGAVALKKPKLVYAGKFEKAKEKFRELFKTKNDAIVYEVILLFCTLCSLSFKIKSLVLCVIFSFANLVSCVLNMRDFKKRNILDKILSIILLLFSICILSAFYMLYMLN